MPDAFELPWVLGAVVPLMSGERLAGFRGGVIHELVALAFWRASGTGLFAWRRPWLYPSFATVIRSLNDLPEPAAALGGIDAIRVGGRALEVVHLPACKMGTADVPLFALAV